MNNRELYRNTFSKVHASADMTMEDIMNTKHRCPCPGAALCSGGLQTRHADAGRSGGYVLPVHSGGRGFPVISLLTERVA